VKIIDNLELPGGMIRLYKDNKELSAKLDIRVMAYAKTKRQALEKIVQKLEAMATEANKLLAETKEEDPAISNTIAKVSVKIDNNAARLAKFRPNNTDNEYDNYQDSLEQQELALK
jgi:hypothetical protein